MLIFDIESNGLYYETTELHCISLYDTSTQQMETYSTLQGNILEGVSRLAYADCLCGHNIINFDVPVLRKLYPKFAWRMKLLDTLLMSRYLFGDIYSFSVSHFPQVELKYHLTHSLEAWGRRLGEWKGDFSKERADELIQHCKDNNIIAPTKNDIQRHVWSTCTPEMVSYCDQDVTVTRKLYRYLKSKLEDSDKEPLMMEHEFAQIINRQEKNGVLFNTPKAEQLRDQLMTEMDVLEDELRSLVPATVEKMKTVEEWIDPEDSSLKFAKKSDCRGFKGCTAVKERLVPHRYRTKTVKFNPTSRQQIGDYLKSEHGWTPTKYTDKGNPIVSREILSSLAETIPVTVKFSQLFDLQKVFGMIAKGNNAWLKLTDKDSRIHGSVNTIGAVTFRCTHSKPNLAQVPSTRAFMGAECRSLFTVPPQYKMVGADASGLELRMLAHYLARWDKGEYAKHVLGGDIHWHNTQAFNLVPHGTVRDKHNSEHDKARSIAKTCIYALIYGAGDLKLGESAGGTAKLGKQLRADFEKAVPAYKKLKTWAQKQAQIKGHVVGLDGRRVHCRSQHSSLNVLLQSAGAIVCKKWAILTYERTKHFNRHFILNVHDEFEIEVLENEAHPLGEVVTQALRDITDIYKLNCPLDGEYDVGDTWRDVH